MIEAGYPWGEAFQLKLLALLLREPDKMLGLIEPQFFTSPILVDIARVMRDIFTKHRKEPISLSKITLKELVRGSLGRKGENWPLYRRAIRKIYEAYLEDKPILIDQAMEFARETRYREALVKAEKEVSAGRYDGFHKVVDELRTGEGAERLDLPQWKNLPKYDDFPPRKVEWLVEGLVPAESIIALSGDEGVGKTIFALWLARSLTEGTDFLGRRVFQTPVLYLGPDVSQVNLQSYVSAIRWEPNKDFRIMAMWTGDEMQPPMLDDPSQVEKLYTLAEEKHPLIIVDTLRDLFAGEENSSTDTKPVMDAVRKARAKGATIMFISHPPKGGGSIIRGTGNIPQKVDIPYLMEKDTWRGKDVVVLSCPKKNRFGSTHFRLPMRQLFIPTPAGLRLLVTEVADWKPTNEWKQKEADAGVIQYVKDHPGTNQNDIQRDLKMGDRSVKKALWAAKNEGLLKAMKGKRKELRWYDAAFEEDATVDHALEDLGQSSKPS